MKRLSQVLTVLLFTAALVNVGYQPWNIGVKYSGLFASEDPVSHADRVFEPTRSKLTKMGMSRLGYRVEPGADWFAKSPEFFIVQYALAPLILRPHTFEDDWVLMNYSATVKPFSAPDLDAVEDFGNGLALYKMHAGPTKPGMLGKIWHETEGSFIGTWKRRGDTDTFDAIWKLSGTLVARDEMVFESLHGKEIVLYRKGTKNRYIGRLSDDGTRIENGHAEYQGSTFAWSAVIEK